MLCEREGSNAKNKGVIYSALCKKHKKLYVRQTRQSLNKRFNSCHSDVIYQPDQSDLAKHCNGNDCDIRFDLEILVLEHARGSSDYMRHRADKWIMSLQRYSP